MNRAGPAIGRRTFGTLAAGAAALPLVGCAAPEKRLARLEERLLGRVGIAALNTGTGASLAHRADQRFAMASTYRWMLAAIVLQRVDAKSLTLADAVPFKDGDLLEYAPVVRPRIDEGAMSVEALCAALMEFGDNTAANVLLRLIGGPNAIARLAHTIGDHTTRLDRTEPTLNDNRPRDPRDTTMPVAMVETMQKVLVGDFLTPDSRDRLTGWMKASQTGLTRLRAGLPKRWAAGNTAGTAANGAVNDVAIAWPPNGPPILIAAYMDGSREPHAVLEAAHAELGDIVADALV